jgi:hypothetical protein
VSLEPLASILDRLSALDADHRRLAASAQGGKKARTAAIEVTLKRVQSLSAKQGDLMAEAAEAAGYALYRSAHVAAFAALVDALHVRIDGKGALTVIATNRKWKLATVEDLQDYADYQVAEAAKHAGVITKAQMKTFHGLLHLRNLCAHPTGYAPDLDQTLGYLSSVLGEMQAY